MTLWSLKMLEMFSKSRPWLMNLILINCVLGGSDGMRGKSLLNENAIIILSLNQSEWRKLLRSASSRIGFSLDTGIEERACRSSCRPLFLAIRKRSSNDLFSLGINKFTMKVIRVQIRAQNLRIWRRMCYFYPSFELWTKELKRRIWFVSIISIK